jgi:hypothetical protein
MKLSKKLAVFAAIPVLALTASAVTFAPAAFAATTPTTATIAGVTSVQDQPAYTSPNNDYVTVADSLVFGAKGTKTTATVLTLVDGKVAATLKSATYVGGSAVKPTLARLVEAGGSKHTYAVRLIGSKGATLATSKSVSYTATLFPAKVAPKPTITITGITSTPDADNGYDGIVTVTATAVFSTNTVATIEALVDGTVVNRDYNNYQGGTTVTLSRPSLETVDSSHVYTEEIVGANGVVLATSAPDTYITSPLTLQQWETSYGNEENTLIMADESAIQADIAADGTAHTPWPTQDGTDGCTIVRGVQTAQCTDLNNLYQQIERDTDVVGYIAPWPTPPLTANSVAATDWTNAFSELAAIGPGNKIGSAAWNHDTVGALSDIAAANTDMTNSGAEW